MTTMFLETPFRMLGYALETDICSFPLKPKWKRMVEDRRLVLRKSFFAPLARSLLRQLSADKPRSNCLLTSFLTRVAAWDESHDSDRLEPSKARKRRLIILRFNGD